MYVINDLDLYQDRTLILPRLRIRDAAMRAYNCFQWYEFPVWLWHYSITPRLWGVVEALWAVGVVRPPGDNIVPSWHDIVPFTTSPMDPLVKKHRLSILRGAIATIVWGQY